MALEDAWVLARALAEAGTAAEAFAVYRATRRDRALRTVAAAGRNARAYHLRGPVRPLAHAGLRLADRLAPGAAHSGQTFLQGGNDCLGFGFARDPGNFRCQVVGFCVANIQGHGCLHVITIV